MATRIVLILIDCLLTFLNAYYFMLALDNPDKYPKWYKWFTGFVALYCFVLVLSNIARLV